MSGSLHGEYDVIVVGSGAGGMVAAIKAHDMGLKTIMVEKSRFYGGTSALSGGMFWAPANHTMRKPDSIESAAGYIRSKADRPLQEERIDAFLRAGPEMTQYLERIGFPLESVAEHPDYLPDAPGAMIGRAVMAATFDGAALGAEFFNVREPSPATLLFDRYQMDNAQLGALMLRPRGWKRMLVRKLAEYWFDIPWRLRTRRDRRMTMGNALIGRLRKAMLDRAIPLHLETRLVRVDRDEHGVTGGVFESNGEQIRIGAKRGIILAAGGFEHDAKLREQHMPISSDSSWSLTPGDNAGDTLCAARDVGADVEMHDGGWWMPTMRLPNRKSGGAVSSYMVHRMPHSICVNGLGKRFTNEAANYNDFGKAQIADHQKTGASSPCWMIFDASFRALYPAGGLLPALAMPDWRVPGAWWNKYIFRASSIAELATKIGIDPAALSQTVASFNAAAKDGVDPEFGRGGDEYDRRVAGDPKIAPNPSLAPLDRAPYYAFQVFLGDIGTKGGLRTDGYARVLDVDGQAIHGLFAIGNNAGSPFGGLYPGPGGTLGPAMTFGYVASKQIAESADPRHNSR